MKWILLYCAVASSFSYTMKRNNESRLSQLGFSQESIQFIKELRQSTESKKSQSTQCKMHATSAPTEKSALDSSFRIRLSLNRPKTTKSVVSPRPPCCHVEKNNPTILFEKLKKWLVPDHTLRQRIQLKIKQGKKQKQPVDTYQNKRGLYKIQVKPAWFMLWNAHELSFAIAYELYRIRYQNEKRPQQRSSKSLEGKIYDALFKRSACFRPHGTSWIVSIKLAHYLQRLKEPLQKGNEQNAVQAILKKTNDQRLCQRYFENWNKTFNANQEHLSEQAFLDLL